MQKHDKSKWDRTIPERMKIQGSSPPSKTRKIFLGQEVLGIRKFADKSEAYNRTRNTRIIVKLPKPASVEPQPVANTGTIPLCSGISTPKSKYIPTKKNKHNNLDSNNQNRGPNQHDQTPERAIHIPSNT